MKNKFLLSISLFISSISFAQVTPSFGVRAGILSSGIKGDAANSFNNLLDFSNDIVTTKNVTGFFAGGYATIPVSGGISLEPGVFYSLKGYELKGDLNVKGIGFLGANAKAKLQSEYIDFPVVIKVTTGKLKLFAGPQFSYLMSANLNTTAGILGFDLLNKKMDVSNQFNKLDVAVTGGIGYKLSDNINITASYDHGLSKIDANKNAKAYNRAFKIGVGIDL
ncbi:MAG: porin family protein [Chitinophagaceae bacterium]